MNKELFKKLTLGIVILLIVGAIYIVAFQPSAKQPVQSSLLEFQQMSKAGNIEKASVTISDSTKVRVDWQSKADPEGAPFFFDDNSTLLDTTLTQISLENNIKLEIVNKNDVPVFSILMNIMFILGIVILMFFMFNRAGGGSGAMQFGKSRAKLAEEDPMSKVTFKDVAGIDEVKEELQEIIDFLKTPGKFTRFGAKIPKGVMLAGPPGTGKTLIAKAVAGEAGTPFYSISGSEFVELYVGVGASRVRDLFDKAKKTAPCILFIDEIDAVGRQRGAGLGGGNDEREQTLNQLLVEMDGFDNNEAVIVIAATNRPDVLDPALLRPGRFDRQIVVTPPDVKGREEILKVHSKGKPLADDVSLSIIAKRTPGFTGADLANVMNEAALLAARKNESKISMDSIEHAVEREIAGPEKKSKLRNEKENRLVAYHEAGHALTTYYIEGADPVHKVSIVPRGYAGGYTLSLPDEDKNFMTKKDMLNSARILLGGRIAEALKLGDISTGASNDLERATTIIRSMITEYGMTSELGALTFGQKAGGDVFLGRDFNKDRNYSEKVAALIDDVARHYMDECYKDTQKILSDHEDKLDLVAGALMEKEVLSRTDFEALLKDEDVAQVEALNTVDKGE